MLKEFSLGKKESKLILKALSKTFDRVSERKDEDDGGFNEFMWVIQGFSLESSKNSKVNTSMQEEFACFDRIWTVERIESFIISFVFRMIWSRTLWFRLDLQVWNSCRDR